MPRWLPILATTLGIRGPLGNYGASFQPTVRIRPIWRSVAEGAAQKYRLRTIRLFQRCGIGSRTSASVWWRTLEGRLWPVGSTDRRNTFSEPLRWPLCPSSDQKRPSSTLATRLFRRCRIGFCRSACARNQTLTEMSPSLGLAPRGEIAEPSRRCGLAKLPWTPACRIFRRSGARLGFPQKR